MRITLKDCTPKLSFDKDRLEILDQMPVYGRFYM